VGQFHVGDPLEVNRRITVLRQWPIRKGQKETVGLVHVAERRQQVRIVTCDRGSHESEWRRADTALRA
jgi:hypothetical protein